MFTLNERLQKDTIPAGSMGLSLLLLMNDRTLPWFILVPQREGICEIDELPAAERAILMEEIAAVSGAVRRLFRPDKINIGAIGNLVPQLHLHVIGRYRDDRAWPAPIWGKGEPVAYDSAEASAVIARIRQELAGVLQ